MRNLVYAVLISTLVLSSCGTSGQMQGSPNPNAMAAGAIVGGSMGGLIGGAVGSSNNGWWGGRRGSAIGTVIGSIAGAAIGGAVSSAQNEAQPEYIEVIEQRPIRQAPSSNIGSLRRSEERRVGKEC